MKLKVRIVVFVLLANLASGCWDTEDIERRAMIEAIGLDAAEGNRVRVTLELPALEAVLAPAAGGGDTGKTTHTITAEGDSVFGAIPGLQAKSMKGLFAGQIKGIVIGAELARRGLTGHLDMLDRHPKIPPQAAVFLTKGEAREILATATALEPNPALEVSLLSTLLADQVFPVKLWRFMHDLDTGREEPEEAFLPIIAYDARERSDILRGLGVFHGDRLVGELSGNEARMFGLLTARMGSATVQVPVRGMGLTTYHRVKSRVKNSVHVEDGRPAFLIEVHAHGFLIEMTKPRIPLDNRTDRAIEKTVARALQGEMMKVVHKLQSLNSDILGLGELLRAKQPRIWERLDWNEAFPQVPVQIEVQFEMGRTGAHR
ncbi:MAG: Ger(x)C family spore germination protein [Bacteroidota bacterium]